MDSGIIGRFRCNGEDDLINKRGNIKYVPIKISDDAHKCLRVAAAYTSEDLRDLASRAIITFCDAIIQEHQTKPPAKNHNKK